MKPKTGESKSQFTKRFVDADMGDEDDAMSVYDECTNKNNEMKLNEDAPLSFRANSRHIEVRTLDSKLIRKAMFDGVEHLVCPMVMLTPGVRNNVLYTVKDMERHTESWNGRPVVVFHPVNANGAPISAGKPEVFEQRRVGFVFNAKMEDSLLKAEAWIDPRRLTEVHAGCLATIQKEEPLEISTGLFTDDEMAVNEADEKDQTKWPKHNDGKPYFAITRNYRPDHLALLPDKIGACSWADGAGLPRVNEVRDNVWTEEARAASAEARRRGGGGGAKKEYRATPITRFSDEERADMVRMAREDEEHRQRVMASRKDPAAQGEAAARQDIRDDNERGASVRNTVSEGGDAYHFNPDTNRFHDKDGEPVGNRGLHDRLMAKLKDQHRRDDSADRQDAKRSAQRHNAWTEEARQASAEARRGGGGAGKESVTVDDLNSLYRSSEGAASRVGTMLKDGITNDNVSQFARAYETLTKEYGTAKAWKDAMIRKAMANDFAGSNRATVIATVSRLKEGLSTMPDLITRASMALSKARTTSRMNEAHVFLTVHRNMSDENSNRVLNFLGVLSENPALVEAVSRLIPQGSQIIHTNSVTGMVRLCDASGIVRNVDVCALLHDNYGTSEGAKAAWDTRGRGRSDDEKKDIGNASRSRFSARAKEWKITEEDKELNRTYAQDHAEHRDAFLEYKMRREDVEGEPHARRSISDMVDPDSQKGREDQLMRKAAEEDDELNKQWDRFVNEIDHATGKPFRK